VLAANMVGRKEDARPVSEIAVAMAINAQGRLAAWPSKGGKLFVAGRRSPRLNGFPSAKPARGERAVSFDEAIQAALLDATTEVSGAQEFIAALVVLATVMGNRCALCGKGRSDRCAFCSPDAERMIVGSTR